MTSPLEKTDPEVAGIIDPQLTFLTVGQHPRVSFYAEEKCALEILNMSGVGQTLQAIATGAVETSAVAPVAFLNVYVKNPDIDVVYVVLRIRDVLQRHGRHRSAFWNAKAVNEAVPRCLCDGRIARPIVDDLGDVTDDRGSTRVDHGGAIARPTAPAQI